MNPFLKRNERNNAHGIKSEKRLASKLGVRPNPGSGALLGAKGDITRPKFLMEMKSTNKASIGVRKDYLEKISKEALQKGRFPALGVSFVTDSGASKNNMDWVMIPLYVFREQGW